MLTEEYIIKSLQEVVRYIIKNKLKKSQDAANFILLNCQHFLRKEKFNGDFVPETFHLFSVTNLLLKGFIKTGDFKRLKENLPEFKNYTEDDILAAALLHDSLEDIDKVTKKYLEKNYNKKIADLVSELTNKEDEFIKIDKSKNHPVDKENKRYAKTLWQIKHYSNVNNPLVKAIKLCDVIANIKDYIDFDINTKIKNNNADYNSRKKQVEYKYTIGIICSYHMYGISYKLSDTLTNILNHLEMLFLISLEEQEKNEQKESNIQILSVKELIKNIKNIEKSIKIQ